MSKSLYPNMSESNSGFESSEQVIIRIPGSMVHLIDTDRSVELASGEFNIVQLKQDNNVVAVLARVGRDIQWPLAKDEATVKLDDSHYFFTLRTPAGAVAISDDDDEGEIRIDSSENMLNYGLTVAAKGQEGKLKDLDRVLEEYSAFRVEKSPAVSWGAAAKEVSPAEMEGREKKEEAERSAAAYWTTLAPNVEDYSGSVAKMIAAGSGHLVRGILWCGDVAVDRLNWGHEVLAKRMAGKGGAATEISPTALKRMKRWGPVPTGNTASLFGVWREGHADANTFSSFFTSIDKLGIRNAKVKKMTKMSEKVATGILAGVVKVSSLFTSSIASSKAGQKFFSLLPVEIVLASLDGFNKVCDAIEVAGKNVMSTTSCVATGLVSQRHGEQAAEVTKQGFDAAGHAFGTACAVFKLRKALNPKSSIQPSTIVKAAAAEAKLKAKKPQSN